MFKVKYDRETDSFMFTLPVGVFGFTRAELRAQGFDMHELNPAIEGKANVLSIGHA